jgi:hypothetical protein
VSARRKLNIAATDPNGIASDMSDAIERHTFATQAKFGVS